MAQVEERLDERVDSRWRAVAGYEGYEVSDHGLVRHNGRVLRRQRDRGGYWRVEMWRGGRRRSMRVHLVVAETFIGPRPLGQETNHRDGDKSNARVENLEYVTRGENHAHAYRIGLRKPTVDAAAASRRKPRLTVNCSCGCGGTFITPDGNGRVRRFLNGHNARRCSL